MDTVSFGMQSEQANEHAGDQSKASKVDKSKKQHLMRGLT